MTSLEPLPLMVRPLGSLIISRPSLVPRAQSMCCPSGSRDKVMRLPPAVAFTMSLDGGGGGQENAIEGRYVRPTIAVQIRYRESRSCAGEGLLGLERAVSIPQQHG